MTTLRDEYPLSPKKIIKKTIVTALPFVFVILAVSSPIFVVLIFSINAGSTSLIGVTATLLLCAVVVAAVNWWSKRYFQVYFYDVSEKGVEIRKGVFFPRTVTVPMEKVSDIYIDQDIFDHYFGLYDLHFSAASATSGFFAHIDGMDKDTTDALHAFLLKSFKESRGETVQVSAKSAQPSLAQKTIASFKPASIGFWLNLISIELLIILVGLPLFVPIWTAGVPAPLVFLLYLITAGIAAFFYKKSFDSLVYEVRNDGIWIHKGWLMPSETMLFYSNIQDTNIDQSIIQRIFGIETLSVKSMSMLSAVYARMDFLTVADGEEIKQMMSKMLEQKVAEQKGKPAATTVTSLAAARSLGAPQLRPYPNHFIRGKLFEVSPISLIFLIGALLLWVFHPSALSVSGIQIGALLLVGVAVLFVLLAFFAAILDSISYKYWLQKDGLVMQVGIFSKVQKVVPYAKIQDAKIICGFIGSLFDFCTMQIESGSMQMVPNTRQSNYADAFSALGYIPYLSLQDANTLRAKLLDLAVISYPKNSSPLRNTMPLSHLKPLKKTVGKVGIMSVQLLLLSITLTLTLPKPTSLLFWYASVIVVIYMLFGIALYPYELLYWKRYFYDANDDSLVIHKGVWGYKEIVVPFRNIQSVYVDQDWYDVFFNLWDVWITTVTATSGPMAHVDGLEQGDAEKLADLLVERIEDSRRV